MAASIFDKIKDQLATAKSEYKARRKELERQLAELDREYGALFGEIDGGKKPGRRARSKLEYGGVRNAVLDAVKSNRGIKPAQIVEKTGLSSPQVHNALTGLKKTKEVRVKDGLYTAA